MSKICGTELQDTDKKCPNCNADVEVKKTTEDVEVNKATTTKSNLLSDKKTLTIIGIAAAAVLLVVILLVVALSGGYKKPIKNYFKGSQTYNAKTIVKAFPTFMKDDKLDKYDEDYMEDFKEDLEKEYGKRVKYDYKIIGKIKLEKEDLEKAQKSLEKKYDDVKIKVTDGYQLCLQIKIKGSEDHEEYFYPYSVYKVNGKWCLISE